MAPGPRLVGLSKMYRIRQQELLDKLRKKCLKKSCGSIKQLGCAFRRMDVDFSKKICFEELREGVRMYGIDMSEEELHVLFNTFDKDRDKLIDFHEFLMPCDPPMCNAGSGSSMKPSTSWTRTAMGKNAQKHPKYLSGQWTEEQVMNFFLESLDTPGTPDGVITREEFQNYYAGVSSTIDDDCYFDLLMRACYDLKTRGS
ncbi:hypothetical protein C0Q70_01860 [Pomacea canaliculata]|uniref:EF-hand domain-containing protein n=1 Tax=Pomacea canaliculata TaxID=400727 RepID=A0A2T7Q0N3_POMCA|nr:hypothetical protein C0Q70_01860 [Pomacea canaliculata]